MTISSNSYSSRTDARPLEFRRDLDRLYPDLYTADIKAALAELAHLDGDRQELMTARLRRRADRARNHERLSFLDPGASIPRTALTVADARKGAFAGSDIPADLRRQWIQGTGPAARPNAPVERSIRNVATRSSQVPTAGRLPTR